MGLPRWLSSKEPTCQCRRCIRFDRVQSLGQEESPGGNPQQYFCLGNPMDRGAWWAAVHEVAKSQTWLERLSTHRQKYLKIISKNTGHNLSFRTLIMVLSGSPWKEMFINHKNLKKFFKSIFVELLFSNELCFKSKNFYYILYWVE